MAILVVSDNPGVTAEQDAALVEALGLEVSPPAGGRVRAAGPTANGWRTVSLWDSEEEFERFRKERLMPALKRAGRAAPTIEIWPIETVLML